MKFKKYFLILLIFVILFSISAAAASDVNDTLNQIQAIQQDIDVDNVNADESNISFTDDGSELTGIDDSPILGAINEDKSVIQKIQYSSLKNSDEPKDTVKTLKKSKVESNQKDVAGSKSKPVLSKSSAKFNVKVNNTNVKTFYNSYHKIKFTITSPDSNKTDDDEYNSVKVIYTNSEGKKFKDYNGFYGLNGRVVAYLKNLPVGKYSVSLKINGISYNNLSKVVVGKSDSRVIVKKTMGATKGTILRAVIKGPHRQSSPKGTVKFIVNGKTYKARATGGVAYREIKLPKAKTYNYKAVFTSKYFKSSSNSSKIIVKNPKKYYTIKAGKYSVNINFKYFKNIKKALMGWGSFDKKFKTNYKKDCKIYKVVKVKKNGKNTYKKVRSGTKKVNVYINICSGEYSGSYAQIYYLNSKVVDKYQHYYSSTYYDYYRSKEYKFYPAF